MTTAPASILGTAARDRRPTGPSAPAAAHQNPGWAP